MCVLFFLARRTGSDGSMSASGSAGPGFDPLWGSKYSLENFQPRGQEEWRCTLSNRQIVHHRPGLNSKPFHSTYVEKAYSTVIAICPSDGDVKPDGPLDAFREEQAMSRHRVSPSPFLSSSSHTTQLQYTYSHPKLNFLSTLYRYSSHT